MHDPIHPPDAGRPVDSDIDIDITLANPWNGSSAPSSHRSKLARRIRFLAMFTISYNVIEAVVAVIAASNASSSALLGFGLDSVIEVSSALAITWQFAGKNHEARDRVALRLIAFSFFGLAAFLAYDSLHALVGRHGAEHSAVGIVLALLSLLIMPAASYVQRRTGSALGSASAVADSKQTLLCTYMSAVLLLGLVANATAGWWWADPLAALGIAALALREGANAWRGDSCCAPSGGLFGQDHDTDPAARAAQGGCGCGPGCTSCT